MGGEGCCQQQLTYSEAFFTRDFVPCKSDTLGTGSYGKVIKVVDVKNNRLLAVKLTRISDARGALQPDSMRSWTVTNEINAYRQLHAGVESGEAHKSGIPLVLAHGVTRLTASSKEAHAFVIMQLLGKDLCDWLYDAKDTTSHFGLLNWTHGSHGEMRPSSFVQLATGMLRSLRYMHSKNLCHRDVKPENFCLADPDDDDDLSRVFLIDMGFAAPVPSEEQERAVDGFLGTPSFASRRVFQGLKATRICDMESLGYSMLEVFKGDSAWELHCPPASQPELGGDASWSSSQLTAMLQQREEAWAAHKRRGWLPPFIIEWFSYLGTLDWNEAPCYDTLERIIETAGGQQHRGKKRRHSGAAAGALQGKPRPRFTASAGGSEGLEDDSCTLGETETLLQFGDEE